MPRYFDPLTDDLNGVKSSYRKDPDLDTTAKRVERDVLRALSVIVAPGSPAPDPGSGDWFGAARWVGLVGYKANPTACEATLRDTLRDVITDVLNWRLAMRELNVHEKQRATKEGSTTTYRDESSSPFPPDWDAPLETYRAAVGGVTERRGVIPWVI